MIPKKIISFKFCKKNILFISNKTIVFNNKLNCFHYKVKKSISPYFNKFPHTKKSRTVITK